MDISGIWTRLGRKIRTILEVKHETEGQFLVGKVIFGFRTIFKKRQASSTFEALNSPSLSWCQRVVRPIFQMRFRPRAFCRVSTGDSEILSSCNMQDEPAIKPLQGNLAFFQVRASWGPFHLKQKTHWPSHINIPEEKLLLMCLWKVGLPLQSKAGNQLTSPDDMGWTEISSSCFTEVDVL